VSVPEPHSSLGEPVRVRIADCKADVLELAAFRDQASRLAALAAAREAPLPQLGRLCRGAGGLILAVRPERWLLCAPRGAPGALSESWEAACAGTAAIVEHSAALTAFYLGGAAAREPLKRGCRLDLDPRVFPAGTAAATFIAQVPVIVGALASGVVLLTPASTARHFREWLIAAATPFGLGSLGSVTVALLSGERIA
jgi:heterotetrameric sarcosine oxidase gamma subunit